MALTGEICNNMLDPENSCQGPKGHKGPCQWSWPENKPSKEALDAMRRIEGELFWGGYFTESQLERGASLLDSEREKARLAGYEQGKQDALRPCGDCGKIGGHKENEYCPARDECYG